MWSINEQCICNLDVDTVCLNNGAYMGIGNIVLNIEANVVLLVMGCS